MNRCLRADPHLCLHCLYPLEPTTPHCPECGRLNNRQDLNKQWSKLLNPDN